MIAPLHESPATDGRRGRTLLRPVALAYHGVNDVADDDDPRRLILSPSRLAAQVGLLRRAGYRFLTAEEALALRGGARPPRGIAVLTFDDGWLDGLTVAAPLLARLGVRATFYVCPGLWGAQHEHVDGDAGRLLDERGARRLHALGMELGSHSLSHADLRRLGDRELARELEGSRAAIERITGRPCRTLAYPYGHHDERVQAAAAAAGYELAWTWTPGPWRALAAPRLPAPPRHGALRLALKLLGIRRRWA